MLRENVHHSRREAAVRNDGDSLLPRGRVESLLLEHDIGVSSEVAEMHADFGGVASQVEVEVIGNCAHHCVAFTHERAHAFLVSHVERSGDQPLSGIRAEKVCDVSRVDVGESYFRDFVVLQQIIRAGGALKPRPENQHSHFSESPCSTL